MPAMWEAVATDGRASAVVRCDSEPEFRAAIGRWRAAGLVIEDAWRIEYAQHGEQRFELGRYSITLEGIPSRVLSFAEGMAIARQALVDDNPDADPRWLEQRLAILGGILGDALEPDFKPF